MIRWNEVVEVQPIGMTRHLRALPRGEPRVEIGEEAVRALFEHRGTRLVPSRLAERCGALPQRLDRLLEREPGGHTVIDMPR